jgi:hypothetical protein
MNICFEYLYRDAGNFKNWSKVVFANPNELDIGGVITAAQDALIDGCYFNAGQVQLPDLQLHHDDQRIEHGWHEAFCFSNTHEPACDRHNRTIEAFVDCLHKNRQYQQFA